MLNNMPRASVIMSVYKEPIEWIRKSIESILGQSYLDFEFIIVNDCPSRDENEVVLDEYAQKDSRIKILSNQSNIGLTKSLNRALSIASGEYIARMDADDISLPDRFKKQIAYLESHPAIQAVGAWIIPIDGNGDPLREAVRYETDPQWVRAQFLQNSQVCHPASMFRRIIGGHPVEYDESIRYAQDYALWVSILPYGEITNIPEPLLFLRSSNQQITSSKRQEQREYAELVQKRAFKLFDFPSNGPLLKVFSSLMIHHDTDMPEQEVIRAFRLFFDDVKRTKQNSLALEVIYSTFLSFLKVKSKGSMAGYVTSVIKNSSLSMFMIGGGLGYNLLRRKIARN